MLRGLHSRAGLAAVLMALLLAPMAAALATPAVQQHGCCKSPVEQAAPQNPEQCCVISGNPGPAPTAIAPARAAGHDHVLVAVSRAAVSNLQTTKTIAAAELTPSPPIGPNCSSILRI